MDPWRLTSAPCGSHQSWRSRQSLGTRSHPASHHVRHLSAPIGTHMGAKIAVAHELAGFVRASATCPRRCWLLRDPPPGALLCHVAPGAWHAGNSVPAYCHAAPARLTHALPHQQAMNTRSDVRGQSNQSRGADLATLRMARSPRDDRHTDAGTSLSEKCAPGTARLMAWAVSTSLAYAIAITIAA
jgi:hypothetical protein